VASRKERSSQNRLCGIACVARVKSNKIAYVAAACVAKSRSSQQEACVAKIELSSSSPVWQSTPVWQKLRSSQ